MKRRNMMAVLVSSFFVCPRIGIAQAPVSTPEAPADAVRHSPDALPGKGINHHPFLYAGEWDTRKPMQSIFLVRGGKIVWSYSIPIRPAPGVIQEFDDATLLDNGNVIFSRMTGAAEIRPDKSIVWDYVAPPGTEVHSVQAIGGNRVLIMRNGTPAEAMIIDRRSGKVVHEVPIPTKITKAHGQFRHIRMTAARTLIVPHLSEGKVVEYDLNGKVMWSVNAKTPWHAVRLKNGNTLIAGDAAKYVREVNPKGETVWEFTQADVLDIRLFNLQTAQRLANGNTVISNWASGLKNVAEWPSTVQILEVTPDKKVVWALRSWEDPVDLGPATSIQLLDQPGSAESLSSQR